MPKQSIFVGDEFPLNCGSIATVVKYNSYTSIDIITSSGYTKNVKGNCLLSGFIKDNFVPSVYGIGYLGDKNVSYKCKQVWYSGLSRCYDKNFQINCPSYIGCSFIKLWHNCSNFEEWFDENYVDGWHLDKDLKVYGNKLYSPETCVFVPNIINSFFYKKQLVNNLSHGVIRYNSGYSSNIKPRKVVYSIKDAKNNYWNAKYIKMQEIIKQYPQFKELLENYFEKFFSELY